MTPKPSETFTISIQGSGNLRLRFRQALLARHPDATIYDRNQEIDWNKPSSFLPPSHQEVADIDVFFRLSQQCDEITLRCRGQHRLFRFNPDHAENDEIRLQRFLQVVVGTVEQLLKPAVAEPPSVPEESDSCSEDPGDPPAEKK